MTDGHQLVYDNDCHWFVIPAGKRREWDDFLQLSLAAVRGKIHDVPVPKFAVPVNGPHAVCFTEWTDLTE